MSAPPNLLEPEAVGRFSDEARAAFYEVVRLRRDVRHFAPDADIDAATLRRILAAAHAAPSVGFSQPWGFVVVRDRAQRARIRESFLRCREAEASRFPPARRAEYLALRLEGIDEAALNVCVCVDLRPRPEAILGATAQPEAVRASVYCAVENLWLAARAEGVGVGWVSIVEPAVLRRELALPEGVHPAAYLCVGVPRAFRARPMLEETSWGSRRPLDDAVHEAGAWRADVGAPAPARWAPAAAASPRIEPPDAEAGRRAREHQRHLAKPPGSLGRLEALAVWYAAARGAFPTPALRRLVLPVFAADHGLVVEAVSAYGSGLTAAAVCNILAGGAAVNVLARRHGVELLVVDVGVAGDLSAAPLCPEVPLTTAKVVSSTANLRRGDAMTEAEARAALEAGAAVADGPAAGADLVGLGEVGIGNTTAAAALVCAFTGAPPDEVVGPGTGVDGPARARKSAVVADALRRHEHAPGHPLATAAALGGAELVAMAGFALRCAASRVPVVLDGMLAGAAALLAAALDPGVVPYLAASHASAEPGARVALEHLGLAPLFDLGLRLGEGTGAILGMSLVRDAVALQAEMATFATAGVRRSER